MATKIDYTFGLLSLSDDLRQPGSKSEPVAVVGTGHDLAADTWHVFVIARGDVENLTGVVGDPVSLSVIRDMPKNLLERVEGALARSIAPSRLLDYLAAGLGASVSFTWIKNRQMKLPESAGGRVESEPLRHFYKYLKAESNTRAKDDKTPARLARYTVEPLRQAVCADQVAV